MTSDNWILAGVVAIVPGLLALLVGAPGWAVGVALLAGFLVALLAFGTRE